MRVKLIIVIAVLLLTSCSKSEVLIELPQMESIDTTYTPRTKVQDTTELHPIRFDVHIIDWEEWE